MLSTYIKPVMIAAESSASPVEIRSKSELSMVCKGGE